MRINFKKSMVKTFRMDNDIILYNPLNHEIIFNPQDLPLDDKINVSEIHVEKPKLRKARVELTLECNCACTYCVVFNNDVPNIGKSMDKETAKKISYQFNRDIQGGTLMLLGGEPLLSWDTTKALFSGCEASEKTLFTNATLIKKLHADYFRDNNILVLVSLDGNRKHNSQRIYWDGRSIFDDSIRGLKILQDSGARVAISTVVTGNNQAELSEIVQFYHQELGVCEIGLTPPHYAKGINFGFDPEIYSREMIKVFEYARLNKVYIDQIAKRIKAIASGEFKLRAYKISGEQVTYYPDGSVSHTGCIKLDSIPGLRDKGSDFFFGKLPAFDPYCQDCNEIGVCGGGCYLDAHFDITGKDQRDCHFYNLILEHIIWDLKDINRLDGRVDKERIRERYKGLI